jgi:hypothetical protein
MVQMMKHLKECRAIGRNGSIFRKCSEAVPKPAMRLPRVSEPKGSTKDAM